jgi:ribosomal RNA-processing protein 36
MILVLYMYYCVDLMDFLLWLCAQESQEASAAREEEKRALVKEHKRRERELTKQGKKPFYLKKCMT